MSTILRWVLNYVVGHGKFRIYGSNIPTGHRLGGHDIQGVTNSYIDIEIGIGSAIDFQGYWQTT